MSRKPNLVPTPDYVTPQAVDKRLACSASRRARRATVRGLAASVGANLPTDALIPSYANQQAADAALAANIARVLGTKKKDEDDGQC